MLRTLLLTAGVVFAGVSAGVANDLSPAGHRVFAPSETLYKNYTLYNRYDYPATFEIFVYDKRFKPVEGWAVRQSTYKLLPDSKRQVQLRFDVAGERKLLVCSKMISRGYDEAPLDITTQVCSRLQITPIFSDKPEDDK